MNILYILTKLDTSDRAEDVIRSTRFLTLNGHKALVVSGKSERVRKIDEVGARHYILALKPDIFSIMACIFKLSNIIKKENVRIVHAMDGLSSFVAFFAARKNERVFISTIYEHKKQSFFDRARLWAKRIIVFSESETRHFTRGGIFLQDKVRLIPPSVEISGTIPDAGSYDPASGMFTIAAAVPLSSPEAAQEFVRAVSIMARTTSKVKVFIIPIAHAPAKGAEEKLKLLIKRHSLSGIISISPPKEERNLIRDADLFINLSVDKEVYARPILEAASQGTPVLVRDADWIKDYVEPDRTAFVSPPCRPEAMADKMLRLYKDKGLRARLAGAARNFVKGAFDVKKIMQAMLHLYEEALSSRNILIIKIGALGDAILAVPSIRAVRKKFPHAKIKLLTALDKRDIFVECPFINEVIVCDFKGRDRGLKRFFSIASKLRYEDFDIAIDLQNNKKSHMLSILACVPRRYGYDNGKLSVLLNRKIRPALSPLDPISHQAKVLGLLGIYNIDRHLELWFSGADEEWADNFLKSHWVKDNTKLVAFSMSSSARWVTKLWPPEYFADVANALAKNLGVRIVLIGSGPGKDPLKYDFLKRSRCKPIDASGKTNVPRLAALIKRCDVLLSSDSAPLHVAASVATPFVALFGPTDPARHLAPADNFTVLKKDFKCSPCYRTYCRRGLVCMKAIKPDEVYEAIRRFLK